MQKAFLFELVLKGYKVLELLIAFRWCNITPVFGSLAIFILSVSHELCDTSTLKYQNNLKAASLKLRVLQSRKHRQTWKPDRHCCQQAAVARLGTFITLGSGQDISVTFIQGAMFCRKNRNASIKKFCQVCWEKCTLGSFWSH